MWQEVIYGCLLSSRQCAQFTNRDCGFVQLNHLAYSPDPTPSKNICSEIWNIIFVESGLHTIKHLKLLLKWGLKDETQEFFFQGLNSLAEVTKMHWCCGRLYWKMTLCLEVCGSFLYRSCTTFWTPLVSQCSDVSFYATCCAVQIVLFPPKNTIHILWTRHRSDLWWALNKRQDKVRWKSGLPS